MCDCVSLTHDWLQGLVPADPSLCEPAEERGQTFFEFCINKNFDFYHGNLQPPSVFANVINSGHDHEEFNVASGYGLYYTCLHGPHQHVNMIDMVLNPRCMQEDNYITFYHTCYMGLRPPSRCSHDCHRVGSQLQWFHARRMTTFPM